MRTIQHYLCDSCNVLIANVQDGFVVQGNIYLADPTDVKGVVGNNFPETDAVKKTVFCKKCLCEALGLPYPTVQRQTRSNCSV
jgi:hypothetical protein